MLIFDDTIAVVIKDFLVFKSTGNRKVYNTKRNFNALSLRTTGSAVFQYGDRELTIAEKSVTFVPAMLDYTRASRNDEMLVIHFDLYGMTYDEIEVYYPENFEEIQALFLQMQQIWKSKKDGYRLKAGELLLKILRRLRASYSATKPQSHTVLFKKLQTEILKNFTDPNYAVTALEESCNVSPVYLRRIFKQHSGQTIKQYLMTLRIEQAEALLTEKYHTIKQVAQLCGFRNEKYFSSVFKKAIGITPGQYKKKH